MADYVAQPATPKTSSLIQDGSHQVTQLQEVCSRIQKIGDMLHGSSPRDVGGKPEQVEPAPTMRRNVDKLNALLSQCAHELDRVEQQL
jgi:hypothetical protein